MEPSIELRLTVCFEDPFWIGVFERIDSGKLSVCKVTFGAEPTDAEIYAFTQRYFYKLKFSPSVKVQKNKKADNPKRRLREAKKRLEKAPIGTKSQQALKKQYEEIKTIRKQKSREKKEAEKQRLYELKQQKRKEKHRGH